MWKRQKYLLFCIFNLNKITPALLHICNLLLFMEKILFILDSIIVYKFSAQVQKREF